MHPDADAQGLRALADEVGLSPRTRELLRRAARRLDGDPPTARDKAVQAELVQALADFAKKGSPDDPKRSK